MSEDNLKLWKSVEKTNPAYTKKAKIVERRLYGGRLMSEDQIEHAKKKSRDHYQQNKELTRARISEYQRKNRDSIAKRKAAKRLEMSDSDREVESAKAKSRYWVDEEYRLDKRSKMKQWRDANPQSPSDETREAYRMRYRSDDGFRMKEIFKSRMQTATRAMKVGRCAGTLELLGCSTDAAKMHIESQFSEGMAWENHGLHGWHIDHIKPCASFDLTLDSEQRKCFHYSNLQPLWAKDNIKKSDKYDNK